MHLHWPIKKIYVDNTTFPAGIYNLVNIQLLQLLTNTGTGTTELQFVQVKHLSVLLAYLMLPDEATLTPSMYRSADGAQTGLICPRIT